MKAKPVEVETIGHPHRYSRRELELACIVAYRLGRGRFVLTLPPRG